MSINKLTELKDYISEQHIKSLHEKAFLATFNSLEEFITKGSQIEKSKTDKSNNVPNLSWVLNSAPGTGKSTALNVICKRVLMGKDTNEKIPLLLVFNNNDTMKNNIFMDVFEFAEKHEIPDAITFVVDDNVDDVLDKLKRYYIVCIPQQRFRDLKLDHGDSKNYLIYTPQIIDKIQDEIIKIKNKSIKRLIIIDEMPIFYDSSHWDITSENNSFDWYERLADSANLSTIEYKNGRDILSELINNELEKNVSSNSNLKLKRFIEGSSKETVFNSILEKFSDVKGDLNDIRRYKWFLKLYHDDKIGSIERDKKQVIICSEWLDYREFNTSILILDGTSSITNAIYGCSGFEFIYIENFHSYSERLNIIWKKINTSSRLSHDEQKEVKGAIVGDYLELLNDGEKSILEFKMVALPKKKDVPYYYTEGVITDEQHKMFYVVRQKASDDMMKHIYNVIGNNDFSKYHALALLCLPIRPPRHYREIAVAIYGVDVDLSLNEDRNKGNWFNDDRVQKIYEEMVLAELSQIIHRTSLRNINAKNKVYIVIYSNRTQWMDILQNEFKLLSSNVKQYNLHDELRFNKACSKKIKEMLKDMVGKKNIEMTAKQIGGKNLSQWFNDNWRLSNRKNVILSELKNNNIIIFERLSKMQRTFRGFKLVDEGIKTESIVNEHYCNILKI